jgi:hypothetical protein
MRRDTGEKCVSPISEHKNVSFKIICLEKNDGGHKLVIQKRRWKKGGAGDDTLINQKQGLVFAVLESYNSD